MQIPQTDEEIKALRLSLHKESMELYRRREMIAEQIKFIERFCPHNETGHYADMKDTGIYCKICGKEW